MPKSSQEELSTVLKRVLELPPDDQERLREILSSLAGGSGEATSYPVAVHPQLDGSPDAAEANLKQWLEEIKGEGPWARLCLLDDALERAEDESERQQLRDVRRSLLQDNPPVAVRYAVARLASERPLAVFAGGVGLGLALFALARGLFRLVF